MIWLNGGPGCSSLDGALMEIGPYKLKDSENLVHQPDSWNEFANLLFVDNPVGTGFSYVDSDSYIHELPEMAAYFVIFLERYFALFPEEEGNDVSLKFSSLTVRLTNIALYSRRILCWSTYSLCRESNSRAQC